MNAAGVIPESKRRCQTALLLASSLTEREGVLRKQNASSLCHLERSAGSLSDRSGVERLLTISARGEAPARIEVLRLRCARLGSLHSAQDDTLERSSWQTNPSQTCAIL